MQVKHFFDPNTSTLTYVVSDPKTKDAVVIDPVLDYDPASGKISSVSVTSVINYIKSESFHLHYILETHVHADHLSSSQLVKEEFPNAKIAIGSRITEVQDVFKKFFNAQELPTDGAPFDILLNPGEPLRAGSILITSIPTPGHTPACLSFLIGNLLFTGDALFMPDYGTGRCDFPRGSADDLYTSVKRLYDLPDETRVFVGHDYQPNGRDMAYETTIGESKLKNIQLRAETQREEFVTFRKNRDKTLSAPKLLYPSIQVNMRAGKLPEPEGNGQRYLKAPIFPLK